MLKEELVEIEYTDDDIVYYIEDQYGNEIGFAVLEDGKEVEYFYADDTVGAKAYAATAAVVDGVVDGVKEAIDDNPFVSREQVAGLRDDLNVLYKENAETVKSLRSFGEDLRDLKDLFSGKPLKPRAEEKPAPAPEPEPEEKEKKKKKKKDKDKAAKKAKKKAKESAGEAADETLDFEPASEPEPSFTEEPQAKQEAHTDSLVDALGEAEANQTTQEQ